MHAARRVDPTVRRMIEEYIGANLHQRLPVAHAALRPPKRSLDWDSLTPRASASATVSAIRHRPTSTPRPSDGWPPLNSIVATVAPCRSAPGSSRSERYAILRTGATLAELRAAGLRLGDLMRYLDSGAVTLTQQPAQEDPQP